MVNYLYFLFQNWPFHEFCTLFLYPFISWLMPPRMKFFHIIFKGTPYIWIIRWDLKNFLIYNTLSNFFNVVELSRVPKYLSHFELIAWITSDRIRNPSLTRWIQEYHYKQVGRTDVAVRADTNAGLSELANLNSLDFFLLIPRKLLFMEVYPSLELTKFKKIDTKLWLLCRKARKTVGLVCSDSQRGV